MAQNTGPVILWPTPASIPFRTPLSAVQLSAKAYAGPPVPVSLTGAYNVIGITTNGTSFAGGFDGSSWAYSSETLGSFLTWQAVNFPLGTPNQPNVVYGATIPLPAGSFGSLLMLGDLVNNQVPPTATFVVTYADGTKTSYSQNMSDWVNPQDYPGESIVQCVASRHNGNGSIDPNSVCVYGYQFALDPTKVPVSLTMPADRDVLMLSMALLPPQLPGSFTYTPASGSVLPSGSATLQAVFTPSDPAASPVLSTSMPLTVTPLSGPLTPVISWPTPAPIAYRSPLTPLQLDAAAANPTGPVLVPLQPFAHTNALYPDGTVYKEKGFDGMSNAYSLTALGSSLSYAGFIFPLGPPSIPDAITSATIPLPAGSFSTLYLLGAAANGPVSDQPFTVNYTSGAPVTTSLSLSSWTTSSSAAATFPGETLVASTAYADTAAGGRLAGNFNVYGYQITLDPTRTVQSLTLPENTNVIFLAAGLGPGINFPVAGSYVYTPSVGTVLPLGTNSLSVAFTPMDTTDFLPTTATNSVVVLKPVLTLTAANASRLYGTPNPTFSGTITGALGGDVFTESFSTPATILSSAGTYPIIPAAAGNDLAIYQQIVNDGTLTINRAPVVASLSAAGSSGLQDEPLGLTVTVQSSTLGTPTGQVHVFANGSLIVSGTLSNGVANLSAALPTGTDTLSFSYDGDIDFLPYTSSTGSVVSIAPLDFTLTAPQGTVMTTALGGQPTLGLQVAPLHGFFAGPIAFSVQGELPPLATASFSPATAGAMGGTATLNVTFGVETSKLNGSLDRPSPLVFAWLALLLPGAALRRTRRSLRAICLFLIALTVMVGAGGCGSGYHNATYPLVITASDGTVTHTLPVTLKIQAQ